MKHSPVVSMFALVAVLVLAGTVAIGRSRLDTAAQEATPSVTVGHPLVGTWIMDFGDGSAPAVNVFTSDGIFLDTGFGISGAWVATGPTTAAFTWVLISQEEDFSGYITVSGTIEVDATGNAWTNTYVDTTVAADGTVIATGTPSTASAKRLRVVPEDASGAPLAEVPSWSPVSAAPGTPGTATPPS